MFSDKVFRGDYTQRIFVMLYARTAYWHLFHGLYRFCQNRMASLVVLNMHTATSLFPKKAPITCIAWQFYWKSLPRAGSGAVSKLVICACDSLVDFGAVWMWLICIFVLLTFPICIFPSSFFYASYLLFYFFFCLLPSRILDPLRFQAGGRRRRPNLGLVCFLLMFAVFLVKDAWCLFC